LPQLVGEFLALAPLRGEETAPGTGVATQQGIALVRLRHWAVGRHEK
jgi:hypothetical protein